MVQVLDPNFLQKKPCANKLDLDQTAPRGDCSQGSSLIRTICFLFLDIDLLITRMGYNKFGRFHFINWILKEF